MANARETRRSRELAAALRASPESPALRGYRLGTVRGVPIAVDWSLLVIFALVTFDLGAGVFPRWHPNWSPAVVWTTALCAAALFFGSVLLHELSHALVARGFGIHVHGITLFLFGGVTHLAREADSPKTEFGVAAVGPLTSLVLGAAAWMLGMRWAGPALGEAVANGDPAALSAALRDTSPLPTLLLWLGPINVSLALFNLVPGFPLDGGRVLRALLWAVTRDARRATRWASLAGQAVALGLIAWGIYAMFTGAFGSGLWLMLIGWFLNDSARRSRSDVRAQQALLGVPLEQVMRTDVERIAPDVALDRFVRDSLLQGRQQAYPVEQNGRVLGIVRASDVLELPPEAWASATVGQVMTPLADAPVLAPDTAAEQALAELTERDVEQLPVVERDDVVGLVSRGDLMRWLALHDGARERPMPAGSA